MTTRTNSMRFFCSILALGFVGCTSTMPPPFPPNNPANPEARVPMNAPPNLFAHDETTLAVQAELSRTEKAAKSSESMQNMSHGDMPGMQPSEMKPQAPKDAPTSAQVQQEKKQVAEEMKKTSDEMEKTSKQLERKTGPQKPQAFYYTCVMHPQIHENQPGKCPICGMTLIKKEGVPPK
ncbi:MAG: hypothetical protein DME97_05085 [Verrucomicrobia bacterium]|nr:MAG: hypothetical protein DME97_05085 [Verrucomicrobiota bacterium]